VLLHSLTKYLNHCIAYDDVAHTSHTIAPICNRLRCEKAHRLPRVLIQQANIRSCFTWTSFDDHVDASIKAKRIHRPQPADAFCSFT